MTSVATFSKKHKPEPVPYCALADRWERAAAMVQKLSPREVQVLGGLIDGLSNKGIARVLNISPRTVEVHRTNLIEKLGGHHSSLVAVCIGALAGFGECSYLNECEEVEPVD